MMKVKNTKINDSDKHSIKSVSLTGFETDIAFVKLVLNSYKTRREL